MCLAKLDLCSVVWFQDEFALLVELKFAVGALSRLGTQVVGLAAVFLIKQSDHLNKVTQSP